MNGKLLVAWRWGAAMLPALGVLALVAQSEIRVRAGASFRLQIRGYDPRDLMRGHYLQYRYEFNWRGEDTCRAYSGPPGEERLERSCCLCLTRQGGQDAEPWVYQVDCKSHSSLVCDGWLRARDVMPPQRFYIPEARSTILEDALRVRRATLEVTVNAWGEPVVKELYLDGVPWSKAIAVTGTTP